MFLVFYYNQISDISFQPFIEILNIAKMHGVKIITKKIKLRVCRRIKTTANEVHVISKLVDVEVHRVKACVDTIQAVINMCSESS